mmetsp:Transcript_39241/g.123735  ORF Transcript_39241/g.123735 Transcript_39241/m.123735 type:complete len:240 (+) Transcript_39241:3599-4318(+)
MTARSRVTSTSAKGRPGPEADVLARVDAAAIAASMRPILARRLARIALHSGSLSGGSPAAHALSTNSESRAWYPGTRAFQGMALSRARRPDKGLSDDSEAAGCGARQRSAGSVAERTYRPTTHPCGSARSSSSDSTAPTPPSSSSAGWIGSSLSTGCPAARSLNAGNAARPSSTRASKRTRPSGFVAPEGSAVSEKWPCRSRKLSMGSLLRALRPMWTQPAASACCCSAESSAEAGVPS